MKVIFILKNPSISSVSYFEPWIIEIWRFFLNFGRIMAIEKLQKADDFSI
jgi:hypothetical protein